MKKLGWVERRDRMEKVFPQLLEACKLALNIEWDYPEDQQHVVLMEKLEQAIAKAEGKD